jgi:hypothetical protein
MCTSDGLHEDPANCRNYYWCQVNINSISQSEPSNKISDTLSNSQYFKEILRHCLFSEVELMSTLFQRVSALSVKAREEKKSLLMQIC